MQREKILIVDDSEMNRAILTEMLEEDFDILEAEDGYSAVAILQRRVDISLVLLDIVMPGMDGFGVLEIMNREHWMEDIPVIMVSAESGTEQVKRAYKMGVTDFIMRPFDMFIVRRRVMNTIMLYAKQKRLINMVNDQIYEKEQRSNMMIEILGHIVEFRNGESGLHIHNVRRYTDFLLRDLQNRTDKYPLTEEEISLIVTASALHDIGKIAIDDKILNKPGRLTDEEFKIMKTHAEIGAQMLDSIVAYRDSRLVQMAYKISRWHHERYDGRGYPDGLKGDEIPIAAQVVALADVFDALTSERVYKAAYSREKAAQMILDGQCGTFNPLLLECLADGGLAMENAKNEAVGEPLRQQEVRSFAELILRSKSNGSSMSERALRLLDYERMKYNFFASKAEEIQFEYTENPSILVISPWGAEKLGVEEIISSPGKDEKLKRVIGTENWEKICQWLQDTTPENPEISGRLILQTGEGDSVFQVILRSVWSSDTPPGYEGAIGKAWISEPAQTD